MAATAQGPTILLFDGWSAPGKQTCRCLIVETPQEGKSAIFGLLKRPMFWWLKRFRDPFSNFLAKTPKGPFFFAIFLYFNSTEGQTTFKGILLASICTCTYEEKHHQVVEHTLPTNPPRPTPTHNELTVSFSIGSVQTRIRGRWAL